MAHRFFVLPQNIRNKSVIEITGDDVQHITKVLRLKEGAELIISAGDGREYTGRILNTGKEYVQVKIVSGRKSASEPPLKVTLCQGLCKGDKMDYIIQKSTELGIAVIIPVATKRTVVRLTPAKAAERQARWQKIAEEAAKQSQRAAIPAVEKVQTLTEVLAKADGQLLLVPWEGETAQSLKEVIRKTAAEKYKGGIAFLIGPEGGLDDGEIAACRARGALPVTLGPRILRTETAGLAVLTMILYELGDLGGTVVGS